MKRMFALLLALAMIFTLGACGSKKLDPDDMVDAMNDFAKNPSTKTFGAMVGGSLAGDEVAAYIKASIEVAGMSEDDFIDMISGNLEDASIKQTGSEELSKDDISDYQDQLDDMVADLKDQLSEMEDMKDMFDEDAYDDMHDALEALIKVLDGAEISDGLKVTLESDGEEEDLCMFNVDGKWFSEALFEF